VIEEWLMGHDDPLNLPLILFMARFGSADEDDNLCHLKTLPTWKAKSCPIFKATGLLGFRGFLLLKKNRTLGVSGTTKSFLAPDKWAVFHCHPQKKMEEKTNKLQRSFVRIHQDI